jgi:hypothetical protein
LTTPTTQSSNVHTLQSKTQKDPQQPEQKKKGKGKKGNGGNDKKDNKNVEGGKYENMKVKLPCKSFGEYYLTHQFPQREEAHLLIKLTQQQKQHVLFKNPFPQGKNMHVVSSIFNQQGGTSCAPSLDEYQSILNMFNHTKEEYVDLLTRSRDYSNPKSTEKCKKTSDP